MDAPFLYKGKKPLKVSAETVFSTVKAIIEAGQEESFLRACREKKDCVSIEAKFINLVKMQLFENRLHRESAMASAVVRSPGGRCPELGENG